ncbi:MAG: flagellar basal body P-ring formation chaperone FlgA [Hyphomicrobiales bacterium]
MKYANHKMILLAVLIATFLSGAVHAATLKSDVTVYSNVVTAKDLFDDAGEYANEPLFLAPDIGSSGKISAHRIASEAHDIGLYDIRLNGIDTVTVRRPSHKVTRQDAEFELKEAVGKALNNGIDFEIVTTSIPQIIHADPRAEMSMTIEDFRLLENGKRFQATLEYQTYGGAKNLPVRGAVVEMATVVVLTREIVRDEVLLPGDVVNERILKSRMRAGTIRSLAGLVGKALTRNLQAGATLREQDVIEPLIVRSNDLVSITYAIPGLLLTSQGRALDSGPKGAVISVRNLQSNRTIRGRITDKGEVIVDIRKPLFAQTNPIADQGVQ